MPAELDEVQRRMMQLEIEREALRKEKDKASKERLQKLEKELADLKEEKNRLSAHWQQEKDTIQNSRKLKEEIEQVRLEIERAQRTGDYAKASELQYGRLPDLERQDQGTGSASGRHPERPSHAQGGSRRGGHRRCRQPLDAHSGQPPHGGGNPEAAADGRPPPSARRWPGRSDHGRRQRHSPRARGPAGSESSAWKLHLSRSHGRGQDRAGQGARRVPVRRRAGDDSYRHVGVPGEAHGVATDRRASRVRRLRGVGPADRSGAETPRTRSCSSTRSRRRIPKC